MPISALHKLRLEKIKKATRARVEMQRTRRAERVLKDVTLAWGGIRDFLCGIDVVPLCPHLKISSALFNSFRQQALEPERLHDREYFRGARNEGAILEARFAATKGLLTTEDGLKFRVASLRSQLFARHPKYPYIVATPDFKASVEYEKGGVEEVLIEVKHTPSRTERDEMMTSDSVDAVWQLACALHIFGLKRGFLVVYRCQSPASPEDTNPPVYGPYIRTVESGNFPLTAVDIPRCMTVYVMKLLNSRYGVRPEDEPADLIEPTIERFFRSAESGEWLVELTQALEERPDWKCAYRAAVLLPQPARRRQQNR